MTITAQSTLIALSRMKTIKETMMSKEKRQRIRRDERPEKPKPIRLTERDLDVMEAVADCRLLSTQQLQTLFFPSLHRTYERLQALYHHAYLDRLFLGVQTAMMNTPILYIIDKRGVELLRAKRGLDIAWNVQLKRVKPTFLEHALAINAVRVSVMKACNQMGRSLIQWQGENELKSDYDYVQIRDENGRIKSVSLIPDSYFALQVTSGKTHFFLELDRGTMQLSRFQRKISAYIAYYHSGLSKKRFGTSRFRVLTVASSKERAENLKRVTEEAGGESRFWFTSLEQVLPETVLDEAIWSVAGRDETVNLIN